eukprot:Nitzschia sp. Nitz4//scaffold76_size158648//92544//93956//NITZ4_002554-RA/size158648-snap-gene-0.295-mRNA-1//1//CDS//3329557869//4765//frame0
MWNLLDKPITEKETHTGATSDLQFGLSSMQGWRVNMEDAHIAETNLCVLSIQQDGSTNRLQLPGHCLFAVFDGHYGTYAAQYSALNLVRILSKQPSFAKYAIALQVMQDKPFHDGSEKCAYMGQNLAPLLEMAFKQAFVNLDFEIATAVVGKPVEEAVLPPKVDLGCVGKHYSEGNTSGENPTETPLESMNGAEKDDSGTTACCVLVTPDLVLCANAGDSRSILYKQAEGIGNTVYPLSFDHKPDNAEEELRIRKAGGCVTAGRVDGSLAMSRVLGDFSFKHWPTKVSPIPEFRWYARDLEADKYLVVASDGIWDVRSNYECYQSLEIIFSEGESNMGLVCEEILDLCLWLDSKDNMTAIVVKFPAQKVGTGGGVLALRERLEKKNKSV